MPKDSRCEDYLGFLSKECWVKNIMYEMLKLGNVIK